MSNPRVKPPPGFRVTDGRPPRSWADYILPRLSVRNEDLDQTTFTNCDLHRCQSADSTYVAAQFDESDLTDGSLVGGTMRHATAAHSRFDGTCFEGVDMRDFTATDSSFTFARFPGSDLTRATFTRCDLRNADLGLVRLDRATALNVDLRDAVLDGARFHKAILRGADLRGASFEMVGTRVPNFEVAWLPHALFSGSTITRARFAGTNLFHAAFDGASFGRVNFRGADLQCAQFMGATFSATWSRFGPVPIFRGAIVHDADFTGATMDPEILAGSIGWEYARGLSSHDRQQIAGYEMFRGFRPLGRTVSKTVMGRGGLC